MSTHDTKVEKLAIVSYFTTLTYYLIFIVFQFMKTKIILQYVKNVGGLGTILLNFFF